MRIEGPSAVPSRGSLGNGTNRLGDIVIRAREGLDVPGNRYTTKKSIEEVRPIADTT